MPDLILVVPSRGRPQNVARLTDAMAETCNLATRLVVGLDSDDEALGEYLLLKPSYPVEFVVEKDIRFVVAWINFLALARIDSSPVIGHIGDDNVPRTVGWDEMVVESLREHPMCFGNDGHPLRPPGTLACHVFMRAELIRALGYMGPPGLRHLYVDNVWSAWGAEVGIEYLHDLNIEHLHPSAAKAEMDEVYSQVETLYTLDGAAFDHYMERNFERDLRRLRACCLSS